MNIKTSNESNNEVASLLSEEDKAKLKAEEQYRMSLRKELEPQKSKNKAWEFLNSSFGIWLFSSIVVGLITWSYATLTNNWKVTKEKEATVREIDTEITYRILDFEIGLSKAHSLGEFAYEIQNFLSPFTNSGQETSAKYSNSNTRALMIELLKLTREKDRKEINQALNGVNEINRKFGFHAKSKGELALPLNFDNIRIREEIFNTINLDLKIPRWRTE